MRPAVPLAAGLLLVVAACGDDSVDSASATSATESAAPGDGPVIDPGDEGAYAVDIDPTRFTRRIDHPYLPMHPGTRWVYEARSSDGEVEIVTVEVLDELRVVMGVETVVVHDVVETEDGALIEDTFDWFAQDADGNVWYFGEDTKAYDEDGDIDEAGAWEAGVDGAQPGIVMPAVPQPSDTGYRQEYLAGEAEDMGQIIAVGNGTVTTRDWTPLEPDVVEEKTYLAGVGFVYEAKTAGEGAGETVVLVEFTAGA